MADNITKCKKKIGGVTYAIHIDKKEKIFTIKPFKTSQSSESKFCGHKFDASKISEILNSTEKKVLCETCTRKKIGQNEQGFKKTEVVQRPLVFSTQAQFLTAISKEPNVESMIGFFERVIESSPESFDQLMKYIYPKEFAARMVDEEFENIVLNTPYLKKWDILCRKQEKFIFLYDTNTENKILVDHREDQNKLKISDIEGSWNNELNNQFRWLCLMNFITMQKKIERGVRFTSIWSGRNTVPNLGRTVSDKNFINQSLRDDLIVVEYLPDMRFKKLTENESYFEKNQASRYRVFDFYDGQHRKSAEWNFFTINNRLDQLLELERIKKIYYTSSNIQLQKYPSSLVAWHHTDKVDFSQLFEVYFDGFTGKVYSYYEIALACYIFLSDIILTEEYTFEEDKITEQKQRDILSLLKRYPASTRTLSDLKNSGIPLCKISHFIIQFGVQDNDGVSVIESLYWYLKSIVKQGYYSMNKIYPEDTQVHLRKRDVIPADYEFRLSGVKDLMTFVDDLFDEKKGVQIRGLYLYLQNCSQAIKKLPAFNYTVWKMLRVKEIRPE